MKARKIIIASLTLAGLGALGAPAQAQQAQGTPTASQPSPQQPDQNQAYPQQQQPYQQQPYQQPYQPQPYQPQPYQPQPYQPQPYQQPYQQQPYQQQPYQPQPYQPQPYQPQPYYPPQPYRSQTGATFVPAPRGQARFVKRPRVGLIIAGAVTLGVTWSLSALAAATYSPYTTDYYYSDYPNQPTTNTSTSSSLGDTTALWPLYIPVLGPWIEMGFLHGSGAPLGGALLAFDGLAQAGGLAMLIAGAVTHTRVAVYARNNLQINPLTVVGGTGLLVSGRF